MSIRELTRSKNMFAEYDYIDIEDKKAKEYRGVFISQKYAQIVKEFLNKRLEKEKKEKLDAMMQFAGSMSGDTDGMSSQEIKQSRSK